MTPEKREVLLAITIPGAEIADWEWTMPDGTGTGEFIIPAKIVNRYGPPEVVE